MTLRHKYRIFRDAATRARRAAEGRTKHTDKWGNTYHSSDGLLSPGATSVAASYARASDAISGQLFDGIISVQATEPDLSALESAEQWIKDCEAGLVTVDFS